MSYYFRKGKSRKAKASAENKNGAASTNGNESAKQFNQQPEAKPHRKRIVDPMALLDSLVLRKFKTLPSDLQNTETKVACINAVLASHKEKCGDPARFYGWILGQAALVKRTFDFMTVCEQKGLKGFEQNVAEHLVIEGKAVCNNIRMNGLASYEGNLGMFRDKLVPDAYRFEQPTAESGNEKDSADE